MNTDHRDVGEGSDKRKTIMPIESLVTQLSIETQYESDLYNSLSDVGVRQQSHFLFDLGCHKTTSETPFSFFVSIYFKISLF
jgi:hypothetical protein